MDATALTVVGTGVALFVALWKVQGNRFDAVDKRFETAEEMNRERFEIAEKMNRERFEIAEKMNRERFEAMDRRWTERFEATDRRWTERFEATDRRFETAERQNEAAHAAICESIAKLDERTRADAAAVQQRFDALNGRFDDLYRHLLGPRAQPPQPGPAPAAG